MAQAWTLWCGAVAPRVAPVGGRQAAVTLSHTSASIDRTARGLLIDYLPSLFASVLHAARSFYAESAPRARLSLRLPTV